MCSALSTCLFDALSKALYTLLPSTMSHPFQSVHISPRYFVFISHAGPDKHSIAVPLRSMLQGKGVRAFVDEMDLRPGDNAPKAMIQAMETARVGVFILSPEFAARKWPVKELYCFLRREQEADLRQLIKPVLIPVFYRLSVEECDGRFLWSKGQDGNNPFRDETFLQRQKNEEDEASLDKLLVAMRTIASFTGVRNDIGASNIDSTEMHEKRTKLLNNVCEAILEKLEKFTFVAPGVGPITSGTTQEDQYTAVFNVPKNRSHVNIDFGMKDTGKEFTCEGRIRELVMERLGQYLNIVGVYGAGGMGKTTAVRHIGNTREVQERFPDGVLYVKLGRDAAVQGARGAIVRIVEASGGKRLGEELRNKKSFKEVIGEAVDWFRGKSILLIVDDVWDHEESGEELGGELVEEVSIIVNAGNESALLFTTRSRIIAQKAVARSVRITAREVHGEEAREILIRSAGRRREDWEDEDVRPSIESLLEICGGLPVALVVSGKGVGAIAMSTVGEKKLAWKEYGASAEACREAALEKSGHDDYPGLFVNAQASLEALSKRSKRGEGSGGNGGASSNERSEGLSVRWKKRFLSLCVLEKQGWGPVPMLQRLWDMKNEEEVKNVVSELEEVGLLDVDLREIGGRVVMGVTMHDLLHDAAIKMAREGGGVGEEHRRLLNAYVMPSGGEECRAWWSDDVPEDHHIHGNVGRHLLYSGGGKELVELLLRPEWMMRQAKLSGIDKLVEDFERGHEVLRGWGDKEGAVGEVLGIAVEGETEREKRGNVAEALRYIKEAVRLGSEGIMKSEREAYFQMQGRLTEIGRVNEMVREYLERMSGSVERPTVRTVKGFLAAPGGALKRIVSLQSGAYCMARVREEGRFVCGCWDGRIVVLDDLRGTVLMEWEAHEDGVRRVALSEDDEIIVSGSQDKTIKMWKREDGMLLKTFQGHKDKVYCVAMTKDARRIISGGVDGAKEWDVHSGSVLKEVEGAVWSLVVTRNEDCVYLGGPNGIRKWRVDELGRDFVAAAKKRRVDGRSEITSLEGKIWRTGYREVAKRNDGDELRNHECAETRGVTSMTLMNSDRVLVTGHVDGTVRMFDTETMTQIRVLEGHSDGVWSIATSEDEKRVLSGSRDNTIRVWSVESGKEVGVPLRGHGSTVYGVCFTHGNRGVISCSYDGTVRIWDADDRRDVKEEPCHDGFVYCVAIMPCGRRVLSGSADKTVRMWDLVTGSQIGSALRGHSDAVRKVAVLSEGDRAVSGSYDCSIRVWDLKEWKEVETLKGHEDWVNCVAATPDELRVVSGSKDETVRIWELDVGHRRHSTLKGHTSRVIQVFVSADGKRVVSVSLSEVIVWDIGTLAMIRRLEKRNVWFLPRHIVMNHIAEDEHDRRVYGWVQIGGTKVFIRRNDQDEDVVVGTLDGAAFDYDISEDGQYMCVATGVAQVGILRIQR